MALSFLLHQIWWPSAWLEKLPARGRNAIPVCRPSNGPMPRRDNRASFRMTFEFFLEIDRPCTLKVLVRVVETASFSAVACERGPTQAAAARQIAWLEEHAKTAPDR
jgi:Bacterial regulatory helix-turn-helix protein, lysR family